MFFEILFLHYMLVLCSFLNSMPTFSFIGLADENESVRDAALGAGHVLVEHYATTYVFTVYIVKTIGKEYIVHTLCAISWHSTNVCYYPLQS